MGSQTEQTESQEEQKYDSNDPDTWRDVENPVAHREAATVDLEVLGELTPSQIENIKEIRRRVLDGRHESFRIHEFKVELWSGGRAYVSIEATRTDCDRYSPRAVLCAERGQFLLGKRGGIKVLTHRPDVSKSKLKKNPLIYGFKSGV